MYHWRRRPLRPRQLMILLLSLLLVAPASRAATLAISCGALGVELELCRDGVAAWSAQSGHQVRVVSTPNSASERLALYQQVLASRSSDIDILQIDVVWPGTLAPHLVDLSPWIGPDITDAFFPALIRNNRVDGRLVAMPWFTDAGVLYYRSDLLEKYGEQPPQSWQQLTRIARRIQNAERAAGKPRMQGFVFQAKGYEGLTCNALEWIHGFGGGRLITSDGRVTLDNPNAVAALELAKACKVQIAKRGQEVAKVLQIDHLLTRKPSELSGEQRQRVAIGHTLAHKPQVFLLDEPLLNLDAAKPRCIWKSAATRFNGMDSSFRIKHQKKESSRDNQPRNSL